MHYLQQPSLVERQPNGQAEIKQNQCHRGSGPLRHVEAKPCGTLSMSMNRLRLHVVTLGSAGECDVFIVVRLGRMQIGVGRLNALVFDDFGHADLWGTWRAVEKGILAVSCVLTICCCESRPLMPSRSNRGCTYCRRIGVVARWTANVG